MRIFTLGACPVCGPMGDLVLVKDPVRDAPFLYCPHCGCAWADPPAGVVDTVDTPETFAPTGFSLPTVDDAAAAQARGWRLRDRGEATDAWLERLRDR
jgi:hypothetical protein